MQAARVVALIVGTLSLSRVSSAQTQAAPPLGSSAPASAHPTDAFAVLRPAAPVGQNVPARGSSVPAGRATVTVHAPYASVTAVATDFEHFREVFPQLAETRVIHRRRGGVTDVYVRVELLDGLGALWAMVRFTTRRTADATVVSGVLLHGTVRRFDFHLEVRRDSAEPARTAVALQLLGVPGFYVPGGLLARQQLQWALRGIAALRQRAELPVPTAARAAVP